MERYELTAASIGRVESSATLAATGGGLCLAIGFFDGVHIGHAEVIRQAVSIAEERGLSPAVMTFDPHPRAVLGQDPQFGTVLTPLDDKLSLLAELGVKAAYVIRFDRDFAEISAERFVRELLLPLEVRTAVVGFDFGFGHRGEGKAESLSAFSGGAIDVQVVDAVFLDGCKVSSTRIRERLAEGDAIVADELLGRPYVIRGEVIHGDKRGRLLGFPTANVKASQPYVIPRNGVYAVSVHLLDDSGRIESSHHAVLNVGIRPTFDAPGGEVKLEAHLFDFEGDLYGRELALSIHSFLRPEMKFDGIEALVAQIQADAEQAKRLLSELTSEKV